MALAVADLIDDRQGEDIVILDVSGPLAIADYFVIATVRNPRHASALARELTPLIKSAGGTRQHIAGLESESGWVLLDFDLVVVHLFDSELRAFYALEDLWSDAPAIGFTPRERPAGSPTGADAAHSDPAEVAPDGWADSRWPNAADDL